ncbi:uncharacterized protein [Aegilops tauschii subsp. strangulata]|uniref:uncharacterized protein n=1 Tax=Aegilops tauschii subsp. strangulata TaxID=200361 RepID=UPI001E1C9ED4|nr:uncharacterized protein LOC123497035 [Aegilops tauschii subsp. strangulata]
MVFLCETRQQLHKMKRLRNRLGLRGFDGISSIGKSGGLALFWDDSMYVSVQDVNARWIDVFVRVAPSEPLWRVTFVYGEPRVENRHLMWESLCRLRNMSELPWLVVGDFNKALWDYEHMSMTARPQPQMMAFRDCFEVCQLVDLGFLGYPFTYDNKRSGRANVQVRLDRAAADNAWRDLFPEAAVTHLTSPRSDHRSLLLRCMQDTSVKVVKARRYEVMWEREASLAEVVVAAWAASGAKGDLGGVTAALKAPMAKLHEWSNKTIVNVMREIEKSRTRLEELHNMNADRNELRKESDHMDELLYKEEMMWLQRSRMEWLKHAFSDKEISDALFQMGPLKAPGPDGFPARFFQRHWGMMKNDIIEAVRQFFSSGVMPEGVNNTTIVLIPKVDNPQRLSEFRPISLCNVIYKIISKCLVNRLRPILGDIISEEQSAFVPGRLITDNAFIAFECTHYIKQEKDPDKAFCAYKMDLH